MKIKITYIVSRISKSLEYEWLGTYLDKEKFDLSFVLLHDEKTSFEEFLENNSVPYVRYNYKDKRHLISALYKVYRKLNKDKPDIINCNLVDAQLVGLIAGKLAGIKNRIYTRHHTVFHHYYARKGILYDKLSNKLAAKIIAITSLVKKVLVEKENVKDDKVAVIPYGFDFSEYQKVTDERKNIIQDKYKLGGKHPVIGVVSRYTHWKGLQYIIPAFFGIIEKHPDAVLVIAGAGGGDMDGEVEKMLGNLPENSYREITFENDVAALFSNFDIFIHAPIDEWVEAFGRIYVEAPASGLPSVFTISGIAHDFVKHEENALVIQHKNREQIINAVLRLMGDKELKEKIIANAKADVENKYTIRKNIDSLEALYGSLMSDGIKK